ncbi:hypothetical protein [uncultured Sphaerochaeta sp.]|uniref:hypothetical protein n=1 Tax=uncultured Sphaerochaeta sp. TaxID=886478 RepID=UPI0026212093|nr:hypothetical protein [uncultured Sphaerochaeta sp.]
MDRKRKNPGNIEPNPAQGQKGDFERLTITMPMDMVEMLEKIRMQRKRAKQKNTTISSLIREAVVEWLNKNAREDRD